MNEETKTTPATAEFEMKVLPKPERSRTYHYGNGKSITFKNVLEVGMRKGGTTHRLQLAADAQNPERFVIVAPGWLAITLDVDGWSF